MAGFGSPESGSAATTSAVTIARRRARRRSLGWTWPRLVRWSMRRSMWGSHSWTRLTSTATGAEARKSWARSCVVGASASCSRPSSARTWATEARRAAVATTSYGPSKPRSADCGPIGSILYYYHRPDGVTPFAETLAALDELVHEGKVCEIGVSNLSLQQLEECASATSGAGLTPVRALQNACNLLDRGQLEAVVPRCRELGIGFVPYFPLASGLLTGKYHRGSPAPAGTRLARRGGLPPNAEFDVVEALDEFARARGHSLLQLAISALASTPGVASVIAGATTPEQVRANATGADWELGPDDLAGLHRLLDELAGRSVDSDQVSASDRPNGSEAGGR